MIKKNDDFDLTITGYTSEGSGVGKKDGIAVFVENTAKNDVIKCHIIKAKKNGAKCIGCPMSKQCGSNNQGKTECNCGCHSEKK